MTNTGAVIITAESVTKAFSTPDGRDLPVLDDVSFTLAEGEIVALLGKSGSGKSTLLRCVAGLIAPSSGIVAYRGTPLTGANPGVSMVFQTFALLPWLTVQQNVELGLEARGVPQAVYLDNGSAFVDAWLLRGCGVLGVKLIHSRPGKPEGRGKIERFLCATRRVVVSPA